MAEKPEALIARADKTLAGAKGGFNFFGGRTEKIEKAVELYREAANAYRLEKNGKRAGEIFEKMAEIQNTQLDEPDEATQSLNEASKSYRKTDPEHAARTLTLVIRHYTAKGNFRRAASTQQTLAEIYENDMGANGQAKQAYEVAAGWFEEDNANALAHKLFLKAAELAALQNDYYGSIEHFEKVAKASLNSDLMRFSVKEYLFKASICHLATGDLIGASQAIEKYIAMDSAFAESREQRLMVDLIEAVKESDTDLFSEKLSEFDRISNINPWKTTMFLRIKDGIQSQEVDFS